MTFKTSFNNPSSSDILCLLLGVLRVTVPVVCISPHLTPFEESLNLMTREVGGVDIYLYAKKFSFIEMNRRADCLNRKEFNFTLN